MNRGEMKTALKRFGFDDSDPLDIWINAALHDLETAASWIFLEAVTTISQPVGASILATIPADLELIHSIKVVGQIDKLTYLSRTSWEANILDESTPGISTHFTMVGNASVLLWPVPDAAYDFRVFYHKTLADMTNDVEVPLVPVKLHFAIVQRAAAIALQAENNEDRASSAQSQYQDSVSAAAVTLIGPHQAAEFGQVQDAQEYE